MTASRRSAVQALSWPVSGFISIGWMRQVAGTEGKDQWTFIGAIYSRF